MTEHKTQLFEIGIRMEMIVGFDLDLYKYPLRYEECHGTHVFNEDELGVKLTSVEIVIGGKGVDILPQLTDKEKEIIINELEIWE